MEPTQSPRHSVSVAGVILDDQDSHVLLVQRRDNGRWEPPGGILELGETITEGLAREIREETGVIVKVEALTGVYKNMSQGIVALVYRCRATSEPKGQTDEAAAVQWHPIDSVSDLMPPAYAVRVADATTPGHVTTRAHDGTNLIQGHGVPTR
jgi:ADP-ribose pyrophosphatase YjhB (NUDIX family)